MSVIGFDTKLGSESSVFDIERLSLDAKEKARIIILDKGAEHTYTHYVRNVGDSSKAGYYVCLGHAEKLVGYNGKDPDNCPACAARERPGNGVGDAETIGPAKRRFVVHIGRYSTSSMTGALIKPISFKLQAWTFTDGKFNMLVDRANSHGDLTQVDLILRCTGKQYQAYDMDVDNKPAYKGDPIGEMQYAELLEARHPEIKKLLGRELSAAQLEDMVTNALPTLTPAPGSIQAQTAAALSRTARPKSFDLDDEVDFSSLLDDTDDEE